MYFDRYLLISICSNNFKELLSRKVKTISTKYIYTMEVLEYFTKVLGLYIFFFYGLKKEYVVFGRYS